MDMFYSLLLPYRHVIPCSLQESSHNNTLLHKTAHPNDDKLLIRMLYKGLVWKRRVLFEQAINILLIPTFCKLRFRAFY